MDKELFKTWLASKIVGLEKFKSTDPAAKAYMEGAILSLKETLLQVSMGLFDKKEDE